MKVNLPNQITIGRLLLAIVFFVCLAQFDARSPDQAYWLLDLCTGLFLVAAITDALDGYLARKHNQETSLGRILDPFVDKILVMGAYIFLASEGFTDQTGEKISDVAAWMVVVILGRELLVTSLRGVMEATGKAYGANFYGKAKMVIQAGAIVWVLVTLAHPNMFPTLTQLRPTVVYLTVVVTLLSVVPYLKSAQSILSQTPVSKS